MTQADKNFIETCTRIINEGISDEGTEVRPRWKDGVPAYTKAIMGVHNEYDISKEFPMITSRKTGIKNAIDEILWIWQKKSNNIVDLNSKIWDSWADEDGSIGKAYGFQMGKKYVFKNNGKYDFLDQVDEVRWQLKHTPASRRIMTNIYNHEDLKDMRLEPCAYGTQWLVKDGKLNLILNQRSQDMLTANGWNVMQYAVLQHMFAREAGLEVGMLYHNIGDCHIYDRHIPIVKELLKRKPIECSPKLVIDPNIKNFYDFKLEHFSVEGYECYEDKIKFEVAV